MSIFRRDRDRITIRAYRVPAPPDLLALAESAAREEAGRQRAASRATGLPLIPRSAYRDRDGEPGPDSVVFGPPRPPKAAP